MSEREQMEQEVRNLTCDLTAEDYKVIKCVEYQEAGKSAPYDLAALSVRRQAVRDRINELQATIAALDDQGGN